MMELNPEALSVELVDFDKGDQQEIPPVLDEYLQKIAKTGQIFHPWSKLKPLMKRKMELVMAEFGKNCPPDSIPSYPNTDSFDFERLKSTILESLEFFSGVPFTIQRLCELVTNPKKHYNRTDKYMRGLEKNLLVVSTIEPPENELQIDDRDPVPPNEWVNSDSSNEEHNYSDAANSVSASSPAVNGTVLEDFATVFPSATRIANPSNNIQVAIVSDGNTYQHADSVSNLDYEIGNNMDEQPKENETHYENGVESTAEMKLIISAVVSDSLDHVESCEEKEEILSKEDDEPIPQNDSPSEAAEEISFQTDVPELLQEKIDEDNLSLSEKADNLHLGEGSGDALPKDELTLDAKETIAETAEADNQPSDDDAMIVDQDSETNNVEKNEIESQENVSAESSDEIVSSTAAELEEEEGEPETKRRKLDIPDENAAQELSTFKSDAESVKKPDEESVDKVSSDVVSSSDVNVKTDINTESMTEDSSPENETAESNTDETSLIEASTTMDAL